MTDPPVEASPPKATAEQIASLQGIYLHIPFCVHKCPYCDFSCGPAETGARRDYLAALEREIEESPWKGACPQTLYFGGGTPSELTIPEWKALWEVLNRSFDFSRLAEFTVECNPGTLGMRKLEALRESGVNRISLGVQSFQDDLLVTLGRIHDADCARQSYREIHSAGFENVSLDLMYGLPKQTYLQWEADLEEALSLAPEHLSLYALTLEQNTPFYELATKGELEPMESDWVADLFEYCMEYCPSKGYEQYEISNFSKNGKESRHNLLYWLNGQYLGLGVSAASHVSGTRWANCRGQECYTRGWLEGRAELEYAERLPRPKRAAEEIMLRLRLNRWCDLGELSETYSLPLLETYADGLIDLLDQEYLEQEGSRIRLTQFGRLMASEVALYFLI